MKRSEMREQAFMLLFEKEFFKELSCEEIEEIFDENVEPLSEYAKNAFRNTVSNSEAIDGYIVKYLKGWKLSRLSKVNLAVLRLAFYEIIFEDSVPSAVAVNEAVELAKKYSGEDDYSFVNGVLRSYLRDAQK
ncbi:MAG TPA: transcription antitermination factor NusB [Candidatus Eubacterium faecipullorum]|uniref:Transcription antitermination protein NusB n=1 Tax=Candidatus Eubacterium faecipullorum TaxID=2838571 RepID=A0A9D1REZ9_9FIRM|nr:transcription antitermination factor NusB [Candidatus Eubacterium faecipullorum]